jgi:hypothetical protein
LLTRDKVSLIEGKHSKNAILLCKGDIKDGLLKMILYSNLSEVTANAQTMKSEAVLCLTSSKLRGSVNSSSTKKEISDFFDENNFTDSQKRLVEIVIAEANQNKFMVKVQFSK